MPPIHQKMVVKVTKTDLEELSEFRYRLRCFLRLSEEIAHAEGVTPLQYTLMLHVCAFPGRDWAIVGELADRLQASPHGTAALISRCEAAGLVTRVPGTHDRRQVEVHLTPSGEHRLLRLAALHKFQVRSLGWPFHERAK